MVDPKCALQDMVDRFQASQVLKIQLEPFRPGAPDPAEAGPAEELGWTGGLCVQSIKA